MLRGRRARLQERKGERYEQRDDAADQRRMLDAGDGKKPSSGSGPSDVPVARFFGRVKPARSQVLHLAGSHSSQVQSKLFMPNRHPVRSRTVAVTC
jgi:hypothetical protein